MEFEDTDICAIPLSTIFIGPRRQSPMGKGRPKNGLRHRRVALNGIPQSNRLPAKAEERRGRKKGEPLMLEEPRLLPIEKGIELPVSSSRAIYLRHAALDSILTSRIRIFESP
jgi:hypothetical protein